MKKKIFFFFILLLCWLQPVCAQSTSQDSLLKIIRTTTADTNKVHAYIKYGLLLQPSNPDSAAWYYQQAGALSRKLNYLPGELSYISCYSDILFKNGKADEAVRMNQHAIQIAKKISAQFELAIAYNNLASAYNLKGMYD